jgi:hypothetical protein
VSALEVLREVRYALTASARSHTPKRWRAVSPPEVRGPRPRQETRPAVIPPRQRSYAASPTIRATAFAEITITTGMLDHGFLTDRALRQIRYDCHGIDAHARVIVHLGPMREPDELLMRYLAGLPCPISFGGNWRVAGAAQQMITELRAEVA